MPRDPSTGTYASPSNSSNPAVSGAKISSATFNALIDDIEDALNDAVLFSGSQALTDEQKGFGLANIAAVSYEDHTLDSGQREQARENIAAVGYDAQTLTSGQQEQVRENIGVELVDDDLTVDIPTDYATLQAAIDALSQRPAKQGATITLNIESGHEPTSGFSVANGDYGHFLITSTDPTVTVGAGFTGTLFRAVNARAPVLSSLWDLDDQGDTGFEVTNGSSARILPTYGVINSAGYGLEVRTSFCSAAETVWTGAARTALRIQQGGVCTAQGADVSNSAHSALSATETAIYVSRGSTLNFMNGICNNSGTSGILVRRSWANCLEATITNSDINNVYSSQGSHVIANLAVCTGAVTGKDLYADQGGSISADSCTTTNTSAAQPVITDTNIRAFNTLTIGGALITSGARITSPGNNGDFDAAAGDCMFMNGGGSGANNPSGSNFPIGFNAARASNSNFQFVGNSLGTSNRAWMRTQNSGTWTAWSELVSNSNIASILAAAQAETTTAFSTTLTLDYSDFINTAVTLTDNFALANPSTEVVGQTGFIRFIQDGTGGRVMTPGTDYETTNGAPIVLSTAANAQDVIGYYIIASNRILLWPVGTAIS